MEEALLNGIILVDLRKAFDLVNTDILLPKLEIYNLDDNSLCWFKSYLKDRHQCVQFKGKMSETRPVTHGVPQGSILGPLLFILFMNDLSLYVNSDFGMYADDSTLHAAAKTLDELDLIVNNNVECVRNTDNTKCMPITTFQKATRLPRTDLNIVLDNVTLDNVDSEIFLGVIVDKYLTWKHHVYKTAKTISKNIALLHRIKRYLPHQIHLTFYKTHIHHT